MGTWENETNREKDYEDDKERGFHSIIGIRVFPAIISLFAHGPPQPADQDYSSRATSTSSSKMNRVSILVPSLLATSWASFNEGL